MKILRPSTITALSASSTDAIKPVANLLHSSGAIFWRAATAAVTSATLDLTVTGPVDALCLHACAAGTVGLQMWSGSAWVSVPGIVVDEVSNSYPGGMASHWFTFTSLAGTVRMLLTLTRHSSAVAIQAGCLAVGRQTTVTGVQYPLTEGLVDTSLQLTMSDGSLNYRPRARWRTFAGTVLTDRATGVPAMMNDVVRTYGAQPLAVHLLPGGEDRYFVWGRFDMPQASHAWPTYGQVGFAITEVL